MTQLSRPVLHLIGAGATIVLVGTGVLVGLPLAMQALTSASEADQIVHTNGLQQASVDQLDVESTRMSDLAADVQKLRTQIPTQTRASDLPTLIARAAQVAGATVNLIEADAAGPFTVRDEAAAAAEASAVTGAADDQPASSTPGDADAAQRQQTVRVRLDAGDARAVASFVDELRHGPRILAIDTVQVERGSAGVNATVTLLLFADTTGAEY